MIFFDLANRFDVSLVYCGYKVEKSEFWDVVGEVRYHYRTSHHAVESIAEQLERLLEKDVRVSQRQEEIMHLVDFWSDIMSPESESKQLVRLQLYDFDDFYSFRVLEPRYYFENQVADEVGVERHSYDGRVDVSEPDDSIERVVELQQSEHYFLVPILSKDDLMDVYRDPDHPANPL